MLVDDAIIAIEMMVVKLEEGYERTKAAAYAWSHTAAPMLSGTLITIIGFTPVGFARSSAGEYAGNIFWIVGFALITSWFVAVIFTPYLGVKMLPDIKPIPGGHAAIYATPNYRRLRRLVGWSIRHKFIVAGAVVAVFVMAGVGMGSVKRQFFPNSDRPEVLVEVQMPEGTSIAATSAATKKVEDWLKQQPEAEIVSSYIGRGAVRFVLSYNPELPDPSFAKIIVLTPDAEARDRLKLRLRERIAEGLAPEARLRATQLVFGPYSRFLVNFRVMGPDTATLRSIANEVQAVMRANPHTRQVNQDWGERVPTVHFVLDQDRLRLIGLTPSDAGEQLQFLLTGVPVTQVREDIRTVDVVARASGPERLDPARLGDLTLTSHDGRLIPLSQIGKIEVRTEDPILRRRDRTPTITVRSDIDESLQPPQVSMEIQQALAPLIATLPPGYRIETGGNIEDAGKANAALAPAVPDHDRADAAGHRPSDALPGGNDDGVPDGPAGAGGRRAGPAAVPAALRLQRDPGADRSGGHPDAQHADPDRPDPHQPAGRPGRLPRRGRSDRPARPAGHPDGAGRRPGLHSADDIRLLGIDGLHPDRRYRRRHGADPGLPAGALRDLVQGPAQ